MRLSENLKILYNLTFKYCTSLKYIHIPDSVEQMEDPFYSCYNLTDINIPKSMTIL